MSRILHKFDKKNKFLAASYTLNFYLTKSRFGIRNPDLVTQNTYFVTQNCQKKFGSPKWNFVHENEIS